MRKITYLLAIMAMFWTANSFAADVLTDVFRDDLKTDPSVSTNANYSGNANWGFDNQMSATWAYDATNKDYQFRYALPSAAAAYYTTRTLATAIQKSAIDNKITIQTIVKYYSVSRGNNYGCLYFADSNGKVITGITFWTVTKSSSAVNFQIARATSLNSTGINAAPTVAPGTADFNGVTSSATVPITCRITMELNFNDHTLAYTCENGSFNAGTRVFTASGTPVTSLAQPFIDNTASDFKTFYLNYQRVNAASNSTAPYGFDMYSMAVQTLQTVATTTVNVNYYDVDNPSTIIKTVQQTNQAVGNTYSATSADIASFTTSDNNYYCSYSNTSVDKQTIAGDGTTHVDLLMKKYPVYSGLYTWTGAVDGSWNELNGNFTNGTNILGFQPTNGVAFTGSGSNKTVTLNDFINLGSNNLTINGDGYTLQGTGSVSGTGTLNINLSGAQAATLNLTNNLPGRTQIGGGSITLGKNGALGTAVDVNGATTFTPTAVTGTTLPATNFTASSSINCGAVGTTMTSISSSLTSKVSVSGSTEYASSTPFAFDFAPTTTLLGELELNGTGTNNKFGITGGTDNAMNVTLKGSAFLFLDVSQAAITTVNLSNLNGESNTKLGWGKSSGVDRDITWSVGSSNLNSTFAGTITNVGGYNSGLKTGNNTNFTKVGTGVLTFSGTATTHNGIFTVNGGELRVTGAIGLVAGTTTMNVTGGILSAQSGGHITAGILNVSSGASLNVDAASVATLSAVNVATDGSTTGQLTIPNATTIPTLTITSASVPATGTTFQIVNATDPSTIVYTNTPVVPAGYTYSTTTGVLTYNSTVTGWSTATLSRVQINGTHGQITYTSNEGFGPTDQISVYNCVGQKLMSEPLTRSAGVLNASFTPGVYLVALTVNGEKRTEKVIVK